VKLLVKWRRTAAKHVQVREAESVQLLHERNVCFVIVHSAHVVEAAAGRQAHTDAVGADAIGHGGEHLDNKSGTIFRRATVLVFAHVGAVREELVTQVTVCRVEFDTIKAGVDGKRISFGNTIKKQSDIAAAYERGVRLYAFDSEAELDKIAKEQGF
jgi:hypothetical protein